eukprot:8122008-Alexandrium_andersonii.AAC.1
MDPAGAAAHLRVTVIDISMDELCGGEPIGVEVPAASQAADEPNVAEATESRAGELGDETLATTLASPSGLASALAGPALASGLTLLLRPTHCASIAVTPCVDSQAPGRATTGA